MEQLTFDLIVVLFNHNFTLLAPFCENVVIVCVIYRLFTGQGHHIGERAVRLVQEENEPNKVRNVYIL